MKYYVCPWYEKIVKSEDDFHYRNVAGYFGPFKSFKAARNALIKHYKNEHKLQTEYHKARIGRVKKINE